MATAFKSFRFPPGYPNFIQYNGPPPPKPKPAQRRARRATPPDFDEWLHIDQILGSTAESGAGSEDRGRLTPTIRTAESQGLLYSDNKGDRVSSPKGLPSHQSNQQKEGEEEEAIYGPYAERRDASLDYLFEGSCPEDPIVIEDDLSEIGSSVANVEPDDRQSEHPIDGLNDVVDSQALSFEGISAAITQQFTSFENRGGMNHGDDAIELEEITCGNPNLTSEPSFTQGKRKRSRSADTNGSTAEILDPAPEQPLKNFHSAKRQRSHSPPNIHSVSNCISTPKPTSQVHSITTPNTRDADDDCVSNRDNSDTSILASSGGGASEGSDKEGSSNHDYHGHSRDNELLESNMRPASPSRHSYDCLDSNKGLRKVDDLAGYASCNPVGDGKIDGDGFIDNSGTRLLVGGAAAVQQPESGNSYPLRHNGRMPHNGMSQNGPSAPGNAERRLYRVRSKPRRKASPPDAGESKTELANQQAPSLKVQPRYESLSGDSHRRTRHDGSAGSHANTTSPSPTLPSPVIGRTRVQSNRSDIGGSSKPTDVVLYLVSQGTTFLVATIDEVAIKPLAPDSWQFTGILYNFCDTATLPAYQLPLSAASGISGGNGRNGACAPHHRAADSKVANLEDDECSDDECSDDGNLNLSNDNGDANNSNDECSRTRKRIPWSELDEQRLLAYRRMNRPWGWIFRKFPHRTPGAVRTRWHMLQGTREEEEEEEIST